MRMLELRGRRKGHEPRGRKNSGKDPDVLVDEDVDEWLSGPRRWSPWINKVGCGRLQRLVRKDAREELRLCGEQKFEFDRECSQTDDARVERTGAEIWRRFAVAQSRTGICGGGTDAIATTRFTARRTRRGPESDSSFRGRDVR